VTERAYPDAPEFLPRHQNTKHAVFAIGQEIGPGVIAFLVGELGGG